MTKTLSKTKTWKPKDILIASEFKDAEGNVVTAGRGRLSLPAKARLAELAAEGYMIDGYTVSTTVATPTAPATTTIERVKSSEITAEVGFRYPEHEWKVILPKGAHGVGMRNVCTNCHGSLVVHVCNDPSLMIDGVPTPVEIVGKGAGK